MDGFITPLLSMRTTGIIGFLLLFALLAFVFSKVRATSGFSHWIGIIVVLPVTGLFLYVFIKSWHSDVQVSKSQLVFNVPLYSKAFPIDHMSLSQIQQLDLTKSNDIRLSHRNNGIGLPGFQLGYYKLKQQYQGIDNALIFVTDSKKVIAVPTKHNVLLLFSVDDPDKVLAELRNR